VADRAIEDQVLGYAVQPLVIKHFIYARDGLPPTLSRIRAHGTPAQKTDMGSGSRDTNT
jgi:hypothetical protein